MKPNRNSPRRLFLQADLTDGSVDLSNQQTHYLRHVLRLRSGDSVVLFNGLGDERHAVVDTLTREHAKVQITQVAEPLPESPLELSLLQAVAKADAMDLIIQKSAELGVRTISPVLTEFSVVRLDDARAARRADHWQKIAQSACEQCGRNIVPVIDEASSLNHWFDQNRDDPGTRLIFRPEAATPLSSVGRPTAVLTILIGPEGGFSRAEYECAAAAGFSEVSLGPRVLRTETATIAAVSAAQTLWGDYD